MHPSHWIRWLQTCKTVQVFHHAQMLPEVTLQDGARLFVAAHHLLNPPAPMSGTHRYTFYGLAWLRGGAATFVCDAERFEVAGGSLICMAPGQVNLWERSEQGAHLTLLGFIPEIFTGGALDVRLVTDLAFFKPDGSTVILAPPDTGAALNTLFEQVWQRYTQSAAHDPQRNWLTLPRQREGLLLGYLHAILAEATALHSVSAEPLTLTQSADFRLTRLFRMHAVANALERHPVKFYADLLHVTPDHLTRVIGRVSGKPPSAWLQERVLVEAVRLLTFTRRPIERIAEQLHFPSATQFSQWFRSRNGQTPSQIRNGVERKSDFQQL